jgi:RNA binding exosome subunit
MIYIKEMLEKEVERRKKSYKKAGDILEEKEREAGVQWNTSDDRVDDNIKLYRDIKHTQREALTEAQDALEDFLSKEWN